MGQAAGEHHIGGGPAQAVSMRLNQLPADPGGGGGSPGGQPDLVSSPAQKRAAAKAIENHIEPDTQTSGQWAELETGAVVKAFAAKDGDGWLTSGAVSKVHKTWSEQVQNLMKRLSSEKTALRSTNTVLTGTDVVVESAVRRSSSLDGF